MGKRLGVIVGALFHLYLLSVFFVFVPYYNWTYAREQGFVKWIFLGEVVATSKAVVWPYFVLRGEQTPSASAEKRHYDNSKSACDEALSIVVRRGELIKLTSDDVTRVVRLLRLAVAEAELVPVEWLRQVHEDLPIKYSEEYTDGLRALANGLDTGDQSLALAGSFGYNQFADWMQSNRDALKWR